SPVDGGEEQRSSQYRERREHGDGDVEQGRDLALGDAEEGAEEERLEPRQLAAVKADEEEAEAEREGLEGADRRRLAGAPAATLPAECGERQRAQPAGAEIRS